MIESNPHAKRILVIDDEPAIRLFCQRFLTGEGFTVDIASDGRAALTMLGQREYNLLLCDIKMPLMDGKELYEFLQKEYPDIVRKIVFFTGSAIGQDTENFLENSGRPVLSKPFEMEELRMIIKQTLKAAEE